MPAGDVADHDRQPLLEADVLFLQGLLVACLLGLLQTMTDSHYLKLWELHLQHGALSNSNSQQLHHLLYNFMLLLSNLVTHSKHVFPKDWFLMHMVTNNIILTAMQEIAKPILRHFTKGQHFNYQVRINTKYVYIDANIKYVDRIRLNCELLMK